MKILNNKIISIFQFIGIFILMISVFLAVHHGISENYTEMEKAINWSILSSISLFFFLLYSITRNKNLSYEKYIEALENYKESAEKYRELMEERAKLNCELVDELMGKIKEFEGYEEEIGLSLDEIKKEFKKIKKIK